MRKRFYLGEYHANKLGTLTNDYLDRYNEQYVANTLTVIVYKVVTVVESKIIPIAVYIVEQSEQVVNYAKVYSK